MMSVDITTLFVNSIVFINSSRKVLTNKYHNCLVKIHHFVHEGTVDTRDMNESISDNDDGATQDDLLRITGIEKKE